MLDLTVTVTVGDGKWEEKCSVPCSEIQRKRVHRELHQAVYGPEKPAGDLQRTMQRVVIHLVYFARQSVSSLPGKYNTHVALDPEKINNFLAIPRLYLTLLVSLYRLER